MTSNSTKELFVRFILAQGLIFALISALGLYLATRDFRNSAEILYETTRNDLLLGDNRQVRTVLSQAFNLGFLRVKATHSDIGLVLDLQNPRPRYGVGSPIDIVVTGQSDLDKKLTIIFVADLLPTLVRFSILGLILIGINIGLFKFMRLRIEAAVLRRVENERLRALGEVAVGVAHDLRSPLSLARIIAGKMGDQHASYAAGLRDVIDRIEGISSDLLEKYRFRGEEVVEMHRILEQAVQECRARFPSEVEIKLSVVAKDTFVNGSPDDLRRAFSNLISNAVEACVNSSEKAVEVKLEKSSEELRVAVIDSGKGMDEDQVDRIRKGMYGTWGKRGGSGVGLRSALATFRNANAKVMISSKIGSGTDISVLFKSRVKQT